MQPLESSPGRDQIIPISTYSSLIVPQCEAKSQELKWTLWFSLKSSKFEQLINWALTLCEKISIIRQLDSWLESTGNQGTEWVGALIGMKNSASRDYQTRSWDNSPVSCGNRWVSLCSHVIQTDHICQNLMFVLKLDCCRNSLKIGFGRQRQDNVQTGDKVRVKQTLIPPPPKELC